MLANQWSGVLNQSEDPTRWPISEQGRFTNQKINIPANQLAGISTNQKTNMLANQWVDNFDPVSEQGFLTNQNTNTLTNQWAGNF